MCGPMVQGTASAEQGMRPVRGATGEPEAALSRLVARIQVLPQGNHAPYGLSDDVSRFSP